MKCVNFSLLNSILYFIQKKKICAVFGESVDFFSGNFWKERNVPSLVKCVNFFNLVAEHFWKGRNVSFLMKCVNFIPPASIIFSKRKNVLFWWNVSIFFQLRSRIFSKRKKCIDFCGWKIVVFCEFFVEKIYKCVVFFVKIWFGKLILFSFVDIWFTKTTDKDCFRGGGQFVDFRKTCHIGVEIFISFFWWYGSWNFYFIFLVNFGGEIIVVHFFTI